MSNSNPEEANSTSLGIEPPEPGQTANNHPNPLNNTNSNEHKKDYTPQPDKAIDRENLSEENKKHKNTLTLLNKEVNETSLFHKHKSHNQHMTYNSGFILHNRIGKGSFATVYKGEWGGDLFTISKNSSVEEESEFPQDIPERQTVAVKVVHQSKLKRDRRLMDVFESEMAILKQMKHPHIVHLIDVIQTTSDYNLIMEYCSMGELSKFIRGRKKLLRDNADAVLLFERYPPKQPTDHSSMGGLHDTLVRHILSQIASALGFLREHHLVHRDLKPQNLLLKPPLASHREAEAAGYVGRWDLPIVKVADFGFARFLPASSMAETMCGSPLYMAPEILSCEKYNATADLWSIGAVSYEMIVGKPPFPASNPMELIKMIDQNKNNIQLPADTPPDLAYLVKNLLIRSPAERMSFVDFFALTSLWAQDPEIVHDTKTLKKSSTSSTTVEENDIATATTLNVRMDGYNENAPESPLSSIDFLRQQAKNDMAIESSSSSLESTLSHSHLIPRAEHSSSFTHKNSVKPSSQENQKTSDDSELYVMVEKRTVEINSLADDVQSPSAAHRRLTNADNQLRRRRLSSIAYGASPTSALAQALLKSSVRLFGAGKDNSGSSNSNNPRVSRDSSVEPSFQKYGSFSGSPDVYSSLSTLVSPLKDGDVQISNELEQLATIGKVVSLYADIKFSQLDVSADHVYNSSTERVGNNHHNYHLDGSETSSVTSGKRGSSAALSIQNPSQIDPYLQLQLSNESLILHLKALSVFSYAMDRVSEWFEQEHRLHPKGRKNENTGINTLVQWVRDKFNECMDKAEIERTFMAKLMNQTGTTAPETNAEKLLFDRALEIAKTAAHQESSSTSKEMMNIAELNYGTAAWMLKALLVSEKDINDLSEDDRTMIEKTMAKIIERLAIARSKNLRNFQRSNSMSISPQNTDNINMSSGYHDDNKHTTP